MIIKARRGLSIMLILHGSKMRIRLYCRRKLCNLRLFSADHGSYICCVDAMPQDPSSTIRAALTEESSGIVKKRSLIPLKSQCRSNQRYEGQRGEAEGGDRGNTCSLADSRKRRSSHSSCLDGQMCSWQTDEAPMVLHGGNLPSEGGERGRGGAGFDRALRKLRAAPCQGLDAEGSCPQKHVQGST